MVQYAHFRNGQNQETKCGRAEQREDSLGILSTAFLVVSAVGLVPTLAGAHEFARETEHQEAQVERGSVHVSKSRRWRGVYGMQEGNELEQQRTLYSAALNRIIRTNKTTPTATNHESRITNHEAVRRARESNSREKQAKYVAVCQSCMIPQQPCACLVTHGCVVGCKTLCSSAASCLSNQASQRHVAPLPHCAKLIVPHQPTPATC